MDLTSWTQEELIRRAIVLGVLLIVVLIVLRFVKRSLNKRISDTESKYRARKIANLIAFLLITISVLLVFADRLGGVGIAFGVAGAGIAFALQEVIVSIAGGIYIVFSSNVKVGQRVQVGEITGDIIDVSVLSTTIMETGQWVNGTLYNGRIVNVSNSFVFNGPVYNYSLEYPFLWDEIEIPIRHSSDVKKAQELFEKVLWEVCGDFTEKSRNTWSKLTNKYRVEKENVDPFVTMRFDENWVTFNLRYIVNFKMRRTTQDLIYRRLFEEIKATKGAVEIASSAYEVTHVPADDQ